MLTGGRWELEFFFQLWDKVRQHRSQQSMQESQRGHCSANFKCEYTPYGWLMCTTQNLKIENVAGKRWITEESSKSVWQREGAIQKWDSVRCDDPEQQSFIPRLLRETSSVSLAGSFQCGCSTCAYVTLSSRYHSRWIKTSWTSHAVVVRLSLWSCKRLNKQWHSTGVADSPPSFLLSETPHTKEAKSPGAITPSELSGGLCTYHGRRHICYPDSDSVGLICVYIQQRPFIT